MRDLAGRVRLVRRCMQDRELRDPRLLWALLRTPRGIFLPTSDRPSVDAPTPASSLSGQTVTDAGFVATAIASARLRVGARVLEVGTGTGYQAAILAAMGCDVTTVEILPELHALALANLRHIGRGSVDCRLGDGTAGASDRAPFDAIIVACAAAEVPAALLQQLATGGRLVMPVGAPDRMQTWTAWDRTSQGFERTPLRVTYFVPMAGPHGATE